MSQEENQTPETEPVEQPAQENAEPAEQSEPAGKTQPGEQAGKPEKSKKDKKKDKVYTLTREQMEAAELAAKQLEAVKDQFVRLTAEYDNFRKRTAREKDAIYQDAKADTIREFLGVYDNLERAAASEQDPDSPHKKGLEMILGQYEEILKKLGVTRMDAQGQPFDPNLHNAVMHVEDESLGENVVADVFQAGFLLGDRVLRHATVRVAN